MQITQVKLRENRARNWFGHQGLKPMTYGQINGYWAPLRIWLDRDKGYWAQAGDMAPEMQPEEFGLLPGLCRVNREDYRVPGTREPKTWITAKGCRP